MGLPLIPLRMWPQTPKHWRHVEPLTTGNFSKTELLVVSTLLVLIGKWVLIHGDFPMDSCNDDSFKTDCLRLCDLYVCFVCSMFVIGYQKCKGNMQTGRSSMLVCVMWVSKNLIRPGLRISSGSAGITGRSNLFHTTFEVGNFSSGFQSAFT